MRAPLVLRWDLDKTYLVSHFESLRYLVRVPFQRGKDKVSVPGVTALIKAVRRTVEARRRRLAVYFLSASPPQIGSAIREKLELDGVVYEGITFKDQVRHLMYARFDAVLEHVGYKLEGLLSAAGSGAPGQLELLFGDDWESDPFVYSLYADIVAGRVSDDVLADLLQRAEVSRHYSDRVIDLIHGDLPRVTVVAIFILRQRPARAGDLDAFGRRLIWFDNYFECALKLWSMHLLDADGVFEVLADIGLSPAQAAVSFEAACERSIVGRCELSPLRRQLVRAGAMDPVPPGSVVRRVKARLRRVLSRRNPHIYDGKVPDYARLVARWSYRGRKEATHEGADVDHRPDDRR